MQPAASKSQPFVSPSSPPPVDTGSDDSTELVRQFAGMTVTPLPAPGESRRTATTPRAGEDWVALGSPLLAARLRAMIEGVEWITHGPGLHQVVRSYIATAGFPSATQEVLTQVLDEVLPPAKAGRAKPEPQGVGADGQ